MVDMTYLVALNDSRTAGGSGRPVGIRCDLVAAAAAALRLTLLAGVCAVVQRPGGRRQQ